MYLKTSNSIYFKIKQHLNIKKNLNFLRFKLFFSYHKFKHTSNFNLQVFVNIHLLTYKHVKYLPSENMGNHETDIECMDERRCSDRISGFRLDTRV